MIARFSRSYTIAITVLIIFICTVQLLRYPTQSPTDSSLSSQAWQGWLPKVGNGDVAAGDSDRNDLLPSELPPSPPPQTTSEPEEEKPEEDKPTEDKPKEDKPKEDKQKEDKPKEDKPKEERPKEEKPKEDKPKEDKPKGDRPQEHDSEKPLTEKPASPPPTNTKPEKDAPAGIPNQPADALSTQKAPPPNFDALKQSFDIPENQHFDPAGPRPDQIILLTATDGHGHNGGIKNIVENAVQNREEYCAAHGYIHHFVNVTKFDMGPDGHPVWKKLPAIIEAFQTYPDAQWLWWLDLDAIIMTPSVAIEEKILNHDAMRQILKKKKEFNEHDWHALGVYTAENPDPNGMDLLIAQDQNGLNAGSFMLRRTEWTKTLLDVWKDPIFIAMKSWFGKEQDALLHLVAQHPQIRSHVGIVSQRHINPYPVKNEEMGWHKGDLVVHLAGCWVLHQCAERWDDMWKQRIKAPPPGTYVKEKEGAKEKLSAAEKLRAAEAGQAAKDKEAEAEVNVELPDSWPQR